MSPSPRRQICLAEPSGEAAGDITAFCNGELGGLANRDNELTAGRAGGRQQDREAFGQLEGYCVLQPRAGHCAEG